MTDERPSAGDEDFAADLLSGLAFLASADSPRGADDPGASSTPMPPAVWERLSQALAAEPRLAPVVELRPRRRWLPAVAAAAVAVVAVGVGASVLRPAATTVADAPAAPAQAAAGTPKNAAADAPADAAAPAPAEAASGVQAPPPASGPMVGNVAPSTRSMIMPTRVLMTSGTDYTSAGLDQQVDGLLSRAGAMTPELGKAMPTPVALTPVGTDGFTADVAALRDCITGLMHSSSATALIVDRATFDGGDAGIVVVPSSDRLDVWVVGPDCTASAPAIVHHLLHEWAVAGH